jgi:redox-sensitive bicupin YhaK (pirin superfamily)
VLPENWSCTVFAIAGRFDVMTTEETFELEDGMVISMACSENNEPIRFTGLTAAEVFLVSGQPIREIHPLTDKENRETRLALAMLQGL